MNELIKELLTKTREGKLKWERINLANKRSPYYYEPYLNIEVRHHGIYSDEAVVYRMKRRVETDIDILRYEIELSIQKEKDKLCNNTVNEILGKLKTL